MPVPENTVAGPAMSSSTIPDREFGRTDSEARQTVNFGRVNAIPTKYASSAIAGRWPGETIFSVQIVLRETVQIDQMVTMRMITVMVLRFQ